MSKQSKQPLTLPQATLWAAVITGVLGCVGGIIAAVVTLGQPFVQRLVEPTPTVIVVTTTAPQPIVDTATPDTQTSSPIPPTVPSLPTTVPEPTIINTPTPTDVKASITTLQNGSTVGESVIVKGAISGLRLGQRAFLCVKSRAFSRLIYPQGEISPDLTGQWAVESIYRSIGYEYETFVVVTNNAEAARMLADEYYKTYGMSSLPQGATKVSKVIVVTRR